MLFISVIPIIIYLIVLKNVLELIICKFNCVKRKSFGFNNCFIFSARCYIYIKTLCA